MSALMRYRVSLLGRGETANSFSSKLSCSGDFIWRLRFPPPFLSPSSSSSSEPLPPSEPLPTAAACWAAICC